MNFQTYIEKVATESSQFYCSEFSNVKSPCNVNCGSDQNTVEGSVAMLQFDSQLKIDPLLKFSAFEKDIIMFIASNDAYYKLEATNSSVFSVEEQGFRGFLIKAQNSFQLSVSIHDNSLLTILMVCTEALNKIVQTNMPFQSDEKEDAQLIQIMTQKHNFIINNLLQKIELENNDSSFEYLYYNNIIFQLLYHYAKCIGQHKNLNDTTLRNTTNDKIERAYQLLNEDLDGYISVEHISDEIGLNVNTLQSGFKKKFGKTVNEFVRNLRIERSVDLLINSELHVSEIVYGLGLTSRSYFSKVFREKYDMSPTEFRKKYKSN